MVLTIVPAGQFEVVEEHTPIVLNDAPASSIAERLSKVLSGGNACIHDTPAGHGGIGG